jgi:hypothetical protein
VSRMTQLISDLFLPIGPGQTLMSIAAQTIPGAAEVLPVGEERVGVGGQWFQFPGLNVRAPTSADLLDEQAREFTRDSSEGPRGTGDLTATEWIRFNDQLPENIQTELDLRLAEAVRQRKPWALNRTVQNNLDGIGGIHPVTNEAVEGRLTREAGLLRDFFLGKWLKDKNEKDREIRMQFWRGFYPAYQDVSSDIRSRKDEARKSFISPDGLEREDKRPGNDRPLEQALHDYWGISDEATDRQGNFDIDKWVQIYERRYKGWSPGQQTYIDEYRELREHVPGMKEVLDLAKPGVTAKLGDRGFTIAMNKIRSEHIREWLEILNQWEAVLREVEQPEQPVQPVQPVPTPGPTPVPTRTPSETGKWLSQRIRDRTKRFEAEATREAAATPVGAGVR